MYDEIDHQDKDCLKHAPVSFPLGTQIDRSTPDPTTRGTFLSGKGVVRGGRGRA